MTQTSPYKVVVLIISNQPSANLCPLLDSRIRPDEVVLAIPDNETLVDYVSWFKTACQPLAIKCTSLALPDYPQLDAIKECFEGLVEQHLKLNHQLILNNSCGVKSVGVIAHQVFLKQNLPVFFVQRDWLHWLHNPLQQQSINLEDKIRIPSLLASHGIKVTDLKRNKITKSMRNIAANWLVQSQTYTKAMGVLNYYAATAKNNLSCQISDKHVTGHSPFNTMLAQLVTADLITVNGKKLTFRDEDARFFANGGWLEDQVFSELQRLQKQLPELQDVARCVEIQWLESSKELRVENELDVMVLYDNRLIVIECKTKRFNKGKAQDVVYKLGSMIKRLGGIKSTGVIVSFQRISARHCARAQLLDVFVCEQNGISNLAEQLKQFVTHS